MAVKKFRPKQTREGVTKQLALRFDDARFHHLEEVCKRLGISKQSFCLQAIDFAIENLEEN